MIDTHCLLLVLNIWRRYLAPVEVQVRRTELWETSDSTSWGGWGGNSRVVIEHHSETVFVKNERKMPFTCEWGGTTIVCSLNSKSIVCRGGEIGDSELGFAWRLIELLVTLWRAALDFVSTRNNQALIWCLHSLPYLCALVRRFIPTQQCMLSHNGYAIFQFCCEIRNMGRGGQGSNFAHLWKA